MAEVSGGTIKWNLDLDDRKFKSKLDSSSKEVSKFGDNTEKQGGRMAGALGKAGKAFVATAAVMGAAATAAFGKFVIAGGISRALNIEDARAKLKGLGHDTKSIENIMDSALKSVKGTAFGLDAAATAAASAVAAGIEPGKELTRVLSLTGDTATITGRQFNEAGSIINKVLASNRLSMQEVNQLSDAGLPILSMLGKEYGKTAEQMRDMVSKGEVDSKKFLKALETNIAGAALASGETTRGAWANMQAAMARVGAAIVEDIIPKVRDAFGDMTKWFDDNSDKIVESVIKIAGVAKEFGKGLVEAGKKAVIIAQDIAAHLLPKLIALWNTLRKDLFPALKELTKELLAPLAGMIGKTLVFAVGLAVDILNVFAKILSPIARNASGLKDVIVALTVSFGALKVVSIVQGMIATLGSGFAVATVRAVGLKAALGSLLASINPITAALVAASAVYSIINGLVNKATNAQIAFMEAQAKAAEEAAKNAATKYQDAIKAYKDLNSIAQSYLSTTKQLTSAEEAVKVARQKLTDATRRYGEGSKQAKDAQAELSEQTAKLKELEADRETGLKELIDKTFQLTQSGGALRNTSLKQIEADLASARAIRDLALARGEDTSKIDGVIGTLEKLITIKDQTITTKVKPGKTHAELQEIRRGILGVPESRTISFITDATRLKIPNIVMAGWKGVPFKLPGNAMGTDFFEGGPTVVGERGPEIVNLPRGSQIIPNHEIDNLGSRASSKSEIHIGTINIAKEVDGERWLKKLTRNQEITDGGLTPSLGAF